MKEQSLPIIQIRNCLLVSIQTELHDRLAHTLQESLMERVRTADAMGVILDVSAVEIIDSYITRILNDIGKSVRFMGAECYIVGIRPAVAMTLIEMGVELDSVHTALNLDLALEKTRAAAVIMKTVETEVGAILAGTISAITQRSIFNRLGGLASRPIQQLSQQDRAADHGRARKLGAAVRPAQQRGADRLLRARPRAAPPRARRPATAARPPGTPRRPPQPRPSGCRSTRRRTSPPRASRRGPRRCASASRSSPP